MKEYGTGILLPEFKKNFFVKHLDTVTSYLNEVFFKTIYSSGYFSFLK